MLHAISAMRTTFRIYLRSAGHRHPTLTQLDDSAQKAEQREERLARTLDTGHIHPIQFLHIFGRCYFSTYLFTKKLCILQVVRIRTSGRHRIFLTAIRMLAYKRGACNYLEAQLRDKSIQFHQSLLIGPVAVNHHNHGRCTVSMKLLHSLQCQRSHMTAIYGHRDDRQSMRRHLPFTRRLQGEVHFGDRRNSRSVNNCLSHLFRGTSR